ncbi:xanthine dehydrogenase family protein subunit M [Acrocarpospora macrocephala]|uniref:Carbon-monoxide dehydrogenase medium subunit n=1 Tax=Acrocarpospora macrocephala TaxID=150177 RepID=A0A5M3X041_9ACTN|nr:xanthine dehydrogenase family protein subunit M [Acrocarpospora macrocephala]GES14036.1 carbon-monoxide dehydrogenase medium subunit [Acrocarpospora macrocephala]
MIPASFEYVRPSTVEEAAQILRNAAGDDVKLLAGGQSLLPLLRLRLAYPAALIDLGRIDELRGVRDEADHVFIAAMTTHDEVVKSAVVQEQCPLVALATAQVADPAVRHRGTFGGSMAHADPAGDLPAVALALDMEFTILSAEGTRTLPASEFFVDYLETALGPGEILLGAKVPKLGAGWGFHYEKFHRTAQAWAIVGVAAAVKRENGTISEGRVALTNMGSTPVRAFSVERRLPGVPVADGNGELREAASTAANDTEPPTDLHARPDYRRHLAVVLTERAVRKAAA